MPALNDLTFRLGDTGVVLNTDVSQPFVDITRVLGFDNAPYRETERDHEGTDGGFMDAEFEKGRPLVLEGTIYADSGTVEVYLDSLKANYAPSRTLIPFYFKAPGVGERIVFVKPRGCKYDWEAARRIGTIPVQFIMFAEDPRLYDSTLQQVVINPGVGAITGRSYNKSYNYGYGSPVTPSGAVVVNAGNRDTPAVFTISGPIVNPQIRHDTSSSILKFLISLAGGETLVIDLAARTVKLNNVVNRRNTLVDPNWFFLQPGMNNFTYVAESGSGSLTIAFRSAWR